MKKLLIALCAGLGLTAFVGLVLTHYHKATYHEFD